MNNTKIEWANMTWNPVTGCLHGCEYCYARKIARRFGGCETGHTDRPFEQKTFIRDGEKLVSIEGQCMTAKPMLFEVPNNPFSMPSILGSSRQGFENLKSPYPFGFAPTFHKYRLGEPALMKKPRTIFVCSMADLFGKWVPDEWIENVFQACENAPQHRYLFLTKNPARYLELAQKGILRKSEQFWYGSSAPTPDTAFFYSDTHQCFVSIEPMLEPFGGGNTTTEPTNWIIIGAETGNRKDKVVPQKEWIDELLVKSENIPVFMKDSLVPIVGEDNMRREYPWKMGNDK